MGHSGLALTSLSAGLVWAAICVAQESGEVLHRYTITVDERLETLRVGACFDGQAPARLVAQSSQARPYLQRARTRTHDGEQRQLRVTRDGIRLAKLPADSCIEYEVDVGTPARDDSVRGAAYFQRDLATSAGLWFWRPPELSPGSDIQLEFLHPEGFSVSAPWRLRERSTRRTVYRTGRSPAYWRGTVAIGRFRVEELVVPGARPRLAILEGSPPADREAMRIWLGEAASAVATLYGRFPLDSPQFLVVPYQASSEPVPWARVHRGGGPAAHFFIDQRRALEEFRADWTATHELSHMLLPYVSREDAWLSEGVASYYQNVLRARAGMITPAAAWQKLYAGFERGVRGTNGEALSDVSRNMGKNKSYMRVYWSGAAIALLADIELRQLRGGLSMDVALARLQGCCLRNERMWTARELFAKLDALTESRVFSGLYSTHVHSRRFPDMSDALRDLGVVVQGGSVSLTGGAPLAAIRQAIMQETGSGLSAVAGPEDGQ